MYLLPAFGLNSAKYELKLMKPFLLPILVNDSDIEPMVIKNANPFILFKFGDIQLLDLLNFFGEATRPNSFLKAYKPSETKRLFP